MTSHPVFEELSRFSTVPRGNLELVGGGTLAWALAGTGLQVLVVERGRFLSREPENSLAAEMFVNHRYQAAEP